MGNAEFQLRVAILAVGSELLDGRVLDTNSQSVAQELENYGGILTHVLSCDDIISDIVRCLEFLHETADIIIVSGGLGPTTDDLTREAIAELTGDPLETRQDAVDRLRQLYAARKRALDPSNLKQAMFPSKSELLSNDLGTAPGFRTYYNKDQRSSELIALPGVPREFRQMFSQHLLPQLAKLASKRIEKHTFRIFGLPEAAVNSRLQPLAVPSGVIVSYRAAFPEIHVVLKNPGQAKEFLTFVDSVRAAIEPQYIFSENANEGLLAYLHRLLIERKVTISTAESCTGGMVATLLTELPGSSNYFLGGVGCYSNEVKQKFLGVTSEALESMGAVSAVVARQLAHGMRNQTGSTFALSITGVAGPDGGTPEKPVGTFFVGVATPDDVFAIKYYFNSTRDSVRKYAAYTALDVLRRLLCQLPLPEVS